MNIETLEKGNYYVLWTNSKINNVCDLTEIGYEKCDNNKKTQYNFYLQYSFHYVLKGKGYYQYNGKTIPITENTIFIVSPSKQCRYWQDKEDPWEYIWIKVMGAEIKDLFRMAKFNENSLIYSCKDDSIGKKLLNLFSLSVPQPLALPYYKGIFYDTIASVITERCQNDEKFSLYFNPTVKAVYDYVSVNYTQCDISVESLSKQFGISPNYLSRLFKKEVGHSLKNYIMNLKILLAKYLIAQNSMSIKDIAEKCGFCDQFYFSRIFKKYTNMSPLEYKNNIIKNLDLSLTE